VCHISVSGAHLVAAGGRGQAPHAKAEHAVLQRLPAELLAAEQGVLEAGCSSYYLLRHDAGLEANDLRAGGQAGRQVGGQVGLQVGGEVVASHLWACMQACSSCQTRLAARKGRRKAQHPQTANTWAQHPAPNSQPPSTSTHHNQPSTTTHQPAPMATQ
jgi:hypothetical protein